VAKPETEFWKYWKKNTPVLSHTRLENTCVLGTPDILVFNSSGHCFTIELKVVQTGNKIRLSPHQISFHIRHPINTFILVKDVKKSRLCLYSGKQIDELVACGLKVTPIALGLEDCRSYLEKLG
tara:strand:+ start:321 stop:692 length:372 start_codon:yes stop_codon:yes gene_type:complete